MVSSSLANNPLQKNARKRVHKNCSNDGIVQVLLQPFQRLWRILAKQKSGWKKNAIEE
jgi:hypothetical protein